MGLKQRWYVYGTIKGSFSNFRIIFFFHSVSFFSKLRFPHVPQFDTIQAICLCINWLGPFWCTCRIWCSTTSWWQNWWVTGVWKDRQAVSITWRKPLHDFHGVVTNLTIWWSLFNKLIVDVILMSDIDVDIVVSLGWKIVITWHRWQG